MLNRQAKTHHVEEITEDNGGDLLIRIPSGGEPTIKTPFKKLRSLLVTATVLSYFGFENEVKTLMLRLSKQTRQFLKSQNL